MHVKFCFRFHFSYSANIGQKINIFAYPIQISESKEKSSNDSRNRYNPDYFPECSRTNPYHVERLKLSSCLCTVIVMYNIQNND